MLTRKPRGYVGTNHVTRGGDILAVLATVHLPEATLGPELTARLKKVKAEEWYPISEMVELLETLDRKLGSFHLKQVGWTIFNRYHAEEARKAFSSARDLLNAFDAMYHQANRGKDIGGWKVVSFEANRAVVEKATPHHCLMEQGIVEESLRCIGVRATVKQSDCFRQGADVCRYVIETAVPDERWGGKPD